MSLRRTALGRKTELRRGAPMRRGVIQRAARAKRTIDGQRRRPSTTGPTPAQRHQVAERAGHCCELCGLALWSDGAWIRPHSFHHRQPRGAGGTRRPDVNAAFNLLLLCGTGTTGCHGRIESRRTEAYTAGWLVRTGLDPANTPTTVWWSPRPLLLTTDGRYEETPAA